MSDPVDILARTIWGEARGCGAAGMRHVAAVIMNRVDNPRWWGRDVVSICQHPYQFSCWNADDPNRAKLLAVDGEDGWFLIAKGIARSAIDGTLIDMTGGADSYFAISMDKPPAWTKKATHTYSDGWHSFWRVELPAPGSIAKPTHTNYTSPDNSADILNAEEEDKIA